jgi:serine/threonine protein phosphatase PrpC
MLAAAPSASAAPDRLEVRIHARLAGVSDKGRQHARNEDFLALAAAADAEVLIVCDGVSSSQDPAAAAAAAATAACTSLRHALHPQAEVNESLMAAAVAAAGAAVAAVPCRAGDDKDPPETTLVAAVRRGRRLVLAWLGDSRAYFVGPSGARQLTEDHSWVNEVVAAGVMSRAQAEHSPQAHCITRTLGGPTGDDRPSLLTLDIPDAAAYLLLCTDGLWNCCREPWRLAHLLGPTRLRPGSEALAAARAVVDFACERSGVDNITAAVLALGPTA